MDNIKRELNGLITQLNMYRDSYYNHNESLISDSEYDKLYDKLCKLEADTGIIMANSPTQNVGYDVKSKLEKIQHSHPLLSLDKTEDVSDLRKFVGDKECVLSAKMDGLTVLLTYENGELIRGETRGNGYEGEIITHNVKTFVNVPLKIPYKGHFEIEGEAIITYRDFNMINSKLPQDGKYKNPRNLAAGSVRQLDSRITKDRNVRFIAWKLSDADNMVKDFEIAESYGFEVVPFAFIKPPVSDIALQAVIDGLKNSVEEKAFPIDGLVMTYNDMQNYGLTLGQTAHHPKHSIAYKFYQEENETTLVDIEWNVSRTGLVNPIAILEPVEIDGTTVQRATLNNVSIIKELKLGIGDTVTLIKAHQIIPQIKSNLTQSDSYVIPDKCPCCGNKLVIKSDNGRAMLYCTNEECPDILHDRVANFASRDAMNIVGISEKRLKLLMDKGYITDFASIYNLYNYKAEIEQLEGFGETSASNLLKAIDDSKECSLANVLVAIGIPEIGKSAAKLIAKHCVAKANGENALKYFIQMALDNYDWTRLDTFGEKTRDAINDYIVRAHDQIIPLVDILKITDNTDDSVANNIFGGQSFCVTGKLYRYKNRDDIVAAIESHGGKIVSGVTKKTNYLITNDKSSGSSKNKNAEKYGTTIISEDEFIAMIS